MKKKINRILLSNVQKPGRYIGEELNIVKKEITDDLLRVALIFPDLYELGMSYVGFKILYDIINKTSFSYAERVFAPWLDAEEIMRKNDIPIFSLETKTPLFKFDVIGFTLQYELSYTNILNILDLGHVPLLEKERKEKDPIIIGGGPGAFNPEPIADFFDLFLLGDGEEQVPNILKIIHKGKTLNLRKSEIIYNVSKLQGVYVPAYYDVIYEGNKIKNITTKNNAPYPVKKAVVKDLNDVPYPEKPIVPYINIVHDRAPIEIFRGCDRGCRFCQAGMIYRPVRERSKDNLKELGIKLLKNTGYEDISLVSLSTSDYSHISELIEELLPFCKKNSISISLPSLRVDSFSVKLAEMVSRIKKTGLTFAPEAGTERLRKIINKTVTEENIIETTKSAFENGWNAIKLYFMIGLPKETKDDILGIVELSKKIAQLGKSIRKRKIDVKISISPFVPKPHTPFQWERQNSKEESQEKINLLRKEIRKEKSLNLKYRDPDVSILEGVFSRGDRRLSRTLIKAQQMGQIMDGWMEKFSFSNWKQIFEEENIDYLSYLRERDTTEILPWDHLSGGIKKEFLLKEKENAMNEIQTDDCRFSKCTDCGVCPSLKVYNILSKKGQI